MSSGIDLLQQMMNSRSQEKGAPADTLEAVSKGATDDAVKSFTKNLGIPFISDIFSQGLFKAFETAGWASKSINENAVALSAKGGKGAAILDQLGLAAGKISFNVAAAAVEPMQHMTADGLQGTHMSFGELGMIQPMSTPSMGRGGEGMSFV